MTLPQDAANTPLTITLLAAHCNIIGQALDALKTQVPIDRVEPVVATFIELKRQVAMAEAAIAEAKKSADEAAKAPAPITPAPAPAPAPASVADEKTTAVAA